MSCVIGQKVQIRPDLTTNTPSPFGVNSNMAQMAGKIMTISAIYHSESEIPSYRFKEDHEDWSWHRSNFKVINISADEAFELLLKGSISDEEYVEEVRRIRRERG